MSVFMRAAHFHRLNLIFVGYGQDIISQPLDANGTLFCQCQINDEKWF